MELAEEARNVSVESGQSYYTEEVQSQGAGLTRPVFVTVMDYSSSELKEGAMMAPGISTEMIPTSLSAGRRSPVDQLGLVGPQDKIEQSVLPAPDTKEVGTDPAGPVGPDFTVDQIQPVAEGPVGQYITRCPVGPDGMFPTCDLDQPMADGPVGRFITRSPVGQDGMLSTCYSDQPVADGPVGRSFILGPVGPRRMFSQYKPNQPVNIGPVGQSFTTGPVGTDEMVSNCKQMDRIAFSPVGSTVIPDPAEEMESAIQTEVMKMVVKVGPASLGDTPPSSDSGIHSLGEQWENMSISTADTEAEENGRPTSCNTTGRCESDTRVPPNTEEDEDVVCPWLDCLLNEESDEFSSVDIVNHRKDIQYNEMTICREEYSLVDLGTDGGNSYISVLADFSDDEEE